MQLEGVLDRFIGPGATNAEPFLQCLLPMIAMAVAVLYATQVTEHWSMVQFVLCAFFAIDIGGGVITNATPSAKRWYHRPGQRFRHHFGFVLFYLLHLIVVSWFFLDGAFTWFIIAGGYLLLSATVILWTPLYLRRPVAYISFAGGLLLSTYGLSQPIGLEWFLPLFYLKLPISHLPQEEPYRP